MNDQPWFADGLRFECTQCGDCCTGAPGYVWVNQAEIEVMAAKVQIPVEEFRRLYVRKVGVRTSLTERANGDCEFFDSESRKCKLYEARPRQCRTWPFWESNVRSEEAWEQARQACPGCGHGKLFPAAQIVELTKVIRL